MIQLHATAVAVDGTAVLLRGPSGSGKSDLALRLIDGGARLVSDDRVALTLSEGRVFASAPRRIFGLIEVRGLGVVSVEAVDRAPIGLGIDLVESGDVERLPGEGRTALLGVDLPCRALPPFEASAPAKIRLMLKVALAAVAIVETLPIVSNGTV